MHDINRVIRLALLVGGARWCSAAKADAAATAVVSKSHQAKKLITQTEGGKSPNENQATMQRQRLLQWAWQVANTPLTLYL